MFGKQFGAIWMYIERFYEKLFNANFCDFQTIFWSPTVVRALRFSHGLFKVKVQHMMQLFCVCLPSVTISNTLKSLESKVCFVAEREKSEEQLLLSFVTRTHFLGDRLQVGNQDLSTFQLHWFLFDNQIPQPCFVQNLWTASKVVVLKRRTDLEIMRTPTPLAPI